MQLSISSDNYVRVSDIRRADTDVAPASITSVTARLVDSAGTEVTGSTVTLAAITGDTDSYGGTIPDLALTEHATYHVEVVVTISGGAKRTKRVALPATYD